MLNMRLLDESAAATRAAAAAGSEIPLRVHELWGPRCIEVHTQDSPGHTSLLDLRIQLAHKDG